MKKILSISLMFLMLLSILPFKSVNAANQTFSNINSFKFKAVTPTTSFQMGIALTTDTTWTLKINGNIVSSNSNYLSKNVNTTHMGNTCTTYVTIIQSLAVNDVFEFVTSGSVVYLYANPTYGITYDLYGIYGTTTPTYKDTQFNPNVISLDDQLLEIAPAGMPEYIVYEANNKTYAEYFDEFPNVIINSDAVSGDDKADIVWNGNGDRFVYELNEDIFILQKMDFSATYSTFEPTGEMKILRSSQNINYDNKTYNTGISGYDPDEIGDPVTDAMDLKVTQPKGGTINTNKDSGYIEFVIDTPVIHPEDELTLFHKTNYECMAPRIKINGNWLFKDLNAISFITDYNTILQRQISLPDVKLINFKYERRNDRYIYSYKLLVEDLSSGSNTFNISADVGYMSVTLNRGPVESDIKFTYTDSQTVYFIKSLPVDANSDGVDDNTGQDMTNIPTDQETINHDTDNVVVEDGILSDSTDQFQTGLFQNVMDMFTTFKMFIANIGSLFQWLPSEITAMIVLSMSVGLFLMIMRTFLGR